jgi:ribosomal protein L37AE/L43A
MTATADERADDSITEPSDDPGDRASDEPCPACGGERAILGALGTWIWFRCRNCGIDSTSGAPSRSAFRRRVAQAR